MKSWHYNVYCFTNGQFNANFFQNKDMETVYLGKMTVSNGYKYYGNICAENLASAMAKVSQLIKEIQ